MKKLLLTALCFAALSVILILPLYAQESGSLESTGETTWQNQQEEFAEDMEEEAEIADQVEQRRGFSRQNFEIGIDANAGVDNDLMGIGDILVKDLVIDLNKIGKDIGDNGLNLNAAPLVGLFVNVMNINIGDGVWDFGFFTGADGNLNLNLPKNLFTLLSEGNLSQRSFSGLISASGGVYANAGLRGSARYGRLRVGVRPSLFAPLAVVPKSGITYNMDTEENISLETSGELSLYGIAAEIIDNRDVQIIMGFDISLEGEYALFVDSPGIGSLDVGASISRIPIIPAIMKNRIRITMENINIDIKKDDLLEGKGLDLPDFENGLYTTAYEAANFNVLRPMRFDIFARYRPFGELLVVRPNIGFSVSFNDEQGYFNAGVDASVNLLRNMFMFHLGTGIEENIWKQQVGFAFNSRAFELDLDAVFRSQSFAGSFSGHGFGVNLGLRFGW